MPEPVSIAPTVLTALNGGVFRITLNRPDVYNAFNGEMLAALLDAFKQAEKSAAKVIVLTGAGKAFCAGQDLKAVKEPLVFSEMIFKFYNPLIQKIASVQKPIIAALNGAAAGAGFSLALACDLRVMSDKAKLNTAFIKVGLVPDSGASFFLPRLVGYSRAFDLMTLSDDILPDEALTIGLVNKIVAADRLEAETMAIATRYAESAGYAVGLVKRMLNKSFGSSLAEMLSYEAAMQDLAGSSADFSEGRTAFVEKRKPNFQGK